MALTTKPCDILPQNKINRSVNFTKQDHKCYENSWKESTTETTRLLQHIMNRGAHLVKEMLAKNNCRQMIVDLELPLATITNTIQENLIAIADSRQDNRVKHPQVVDTKKINLPL